MQNIDEKLKARLLKLQALAEQGVGGEAKNAKDILNRLLKKHKISLESLMDDEKTKEYFFKYESKFEKELLFRICAKVKDIFISDGIRYIQCKGRQISFSLTKYEFMEFEILRSAYFQSWEKCLENAQAAFVWKNKLGFKDNKRIGEVKPLSSEEIKEILNIQKMAEGMPEAQLQRNLLESK